MPWPEKGIIGVAVPNARTPLATTVADNTGLVAHRPPSVTGAVLVARPVIPDLSKFGLGHFNLVLDGSIHG